MKYNYQYNSQHYIEDPRFFGQSPNFLTTLSIYDAQWYLKIADSGYPSSPSPIFAKTHTIINGLTFAFFPLFPLLIALLNHFLSNLELSAFLTTNSLYLASGMSLYWVLTKLYDSKIAFKTTLLLFLFPFSIFFRSYFTEGLFLLLLVWFSYFLIKQKFLWASLALGLLCITRGAGLFLLPLLFWQLYQSKQELVNKIFPALVSLIPFISWTVFNYSKTGNFGYFFSVRAFWNLGWKPNFPLFHNILTVLAFPYLPIHDFHYSEVEVVSLIFFATILVVSRNKVLPQLWWISFLLLLGPLFISDLMSFSRYQSVSFPLFLFFALKLSKTNFTLLTTLSAISLLVSTLLFVNWYWVG